MRERPDEIDPRGRNASATLRVIGLSMAAAGIVLTLVGFASFFAAFGTFEPPRYFWCAFLGLPLLGVGVQISGLGFLGPFTRYVSGQTAPVQRDTFNYLAKGTRDGFRTMASAASEGFAAGSAAPLTCPHCQSPNASDARFCDQCGTELAPKPCPRCRHTNESSARFCTQCGGQLA